MSYKLTLKHDIGYIFHTLIDKILRYSVTSLSFIGNVTTLISPHTFGEIKMQLTYTLSKLTSKCSK